MCCLSFNRRSSAFRSSTTRIVRVPTRYGFTARRSTQSTALQMAKGARNKKGKAQTSEGIKLGKGFGEPLPYKTDGDSEEGEWKDDWSTSPDSSQTTSSSSSSSSSKEGMSDNELMDEAAVFEKYGIGKSKTDRFGNEISAR